MQITFFSTIRKVSTILFNWPTTKMHGAALGTSAAAFSIFTVAYMCIYMYMINHGNRLNYFGAYWYKTE